MKAGAVRKLGLLDLAVFLALTAVGLAFSKYYLRTPIGLTPVCDSRGTLFFTPSYRPAGMSELATVLSLFLAAWSIALLSARLRRPRPRLGLLVRSPGLLVSLVVTSIIAMFYVQQLLSLARHGWPTFRVPASRGDQAILGLIDLFPSSVFPLLKKRIATPVVAVLLVSAIMIHRGRAADWVDRTALGLGVCWLLISLV